MTDERAIEILNPEHREHYDSIETVNEACRMGMNAIRRVKELKAENAALRVKLNRSHELPCNVGDNLYVVSLIFSDSYNEDVLTGSICFKLSERTVTEKNIYRMCELLKEKKAYYTKEEANAKIDELLNINNEIK